MPDGVFPARPQRRFSRKLDLTRGRIDLTHGAGGKASAHLIAELIAPAFALAGADDSAALGALDGRLVATTDGHIVDPLFFPGGDIGSLAVNGTVNDLAMAGAAPIALTCGLILEEGLPLSELKRIVDSMAAAAQAAGVAIVAGDTKVAPAGKADRCFITVAGIGRVLEALEAPPASHRVRPGDKILVSGSIGDHGVAILSARGELPMRAPVQSDCAALNGLMASIVAAAPGVRAMRDPTRGGLAAALNEIAQDAGVGMAIREADIPIKKPVEAACEVLGLDPLNLANEGKMVAFVPAEQADAALAAARAHPLGRDAALVGEAVEDARCFVSMETPYGGRRMVDWLAGDPLPRIC